MFELDPAQPISADLKREVQQAITLFLRIKRAQLLDIDAEFEPLIAAAERLTSGGKRIRAACCIWGWAAVGLADGQRAVPNWLTAIAASLELLHASALVHDDVMDSSALRRGAPTVHREFAALHQQRGLSGDATAFGTGSAILLGNLLWSWSAEMVERVQLPKTAFEGALLILSDIRTEVNAGQYLDLLAADAAAIEKVVEYKTSRYTITQPLQLGAALARADGTVLRQFDEFGSALGRAFQYRDDILGVFGDEGVTGKPTADDLREGKLTKLVAHTLELASPAARARFQQLFDQPELSVTELAELRQLITDSGALAATETDIESARATALQALESLQITPIANQALQTLTTQITIRSD
ncbi:MAG: polyprenyl synthetase family protein [Propionibacteriaceae bacterium]|nr:polyprenyl synthetase family protein [Propionibacteriaceae bacterium]